MLIGVIDAISSSGLYRAKLTAWRCPLSVAKSSPCIGDDPPLLSEKRFEKVSLSWLGNESPDTTRTALSARAADVGEHRKTKNELPPPHAPPLDFRCANGIAPQKRRIGGLCSRWVSARYSTSNMQRQDRTRHRRPPWEWLPSKRLKQSGLSRPVAGLQEPMTPVGGDYALIVANRTRVLRFT